MRSTKFLVHWNDSPIVGSSLLLQYYYINYNVSIIACYGDTNKHVL